MVTVVGSTDARPALKQMRGWGGKKMLMLRIRHTEHPDIQLPFNDWAMHIYNEIREDYFKSIIDSKKRYYESKTS